MLAMSLVRLGLVCLWAACSVLASPAAATGSDTDQPALRYHPGPIRQVIADMAYDPNGVFVLGVDGVLRTFAPDHSVVDYRQLDPAQVKALASGLVAQETQLGVEADPVYQYLLDDAEHPEIDGRLIMDLGELLHPTNPMSRPDPAWKTAVGTSPDPKRDVVDKLEARQPIPCPSSCYSIADCVWINCWACFMPWGPGTPGHCFV
ncbi:hypothetical protein N658DRAFT_74060 [Parathielavia hyrcaniae]|uniref:Uncharacterized protein n=1 Tax=Parathielavia hyrcaniae TaxID=113614 RepID=A0AAN6PUL8_9PEZI|nr:hypothetical protein N658DRAFT_74060 [Parathielavia hyrcaniae]